MYVNCQVFSVVFNSTNIPNGVNKMCGIFHQIASVLSAVTFITSVIVVQEHINNVVYYENEVICTVVCISKLL